MIGSAAGGPRDPEEPPDLLVVAPHPDDEAMAIGGTLARYARRGYRTGLITLTRGEAGRTLGLCEPEELGTVRTEELERAAGVLGLAHLEVHDFPNGPSGIAADGMARGLERGEGVGQHPEVADLLVERFRALRPSLILTFPPDGINDHPDHVATHVFTLEALEGIPDPPAVAYFVAASPVAGREDRHPAPTHRIELSRDEVRLKLRAMAQHRTQALSILHFLDEAPEWMEAEHFHRPDHRGRLNRELLR